MNPDWAPDLDVIPPFEQSPRETREMTLHAEVSCGDRGACFAIGCCLNEHIDNDYGWDRRAMDDFISTNALLASITGRIVSNAGVLAIEDYKLLPNRVFGFVLWSRKWGKSFILWLTLLKGRTS